MPDTDKPHDLFDLAFKRLMHLSNTAVINFINGLFGTNHPLTSKVEYFSTEAVNDKLQKTNKDMVIGIETSRYITEIQRKDDKTMPLRIFIYSYNAALNTRTADTQGVITLDFPKAAVIYLENTGKTSETLLLRFPDNTEHTFTVPVLNLLEYSIPDIEKQNLQLLLPFCVLKLYDKVKQAKSSDERSRYKSYNELQEANKMAEQFLELRSDTILKKLAKAEQRAAKAEQKAAREKQAIADFLRANGTPDDLLSRAFSISA
jgi:hypothetical protein